MSQTWFTAQLSLCVIPSTPAGSMGCMRTGCEGRSSLPYSSQSSVNLIENGSEPFWGAPLMIISYLLPAISDQPVRGDMLGQSLSPLKVTPPPAEPWEGQTHSWCQPSQAHSSAGKVWALFSPYVRPPLRELERLQPRIYSRKNEKLPLSISSFPPAGLHVLKPGK